MKLKRLFWALMSCVVLTTSCEKEESKTLYHSYGLAIPVEGEAYSFKINTDLGNVLIPQDDDYHLNDTTRVYVQFTMVNEDDSEMDSIEVELKFMDDILYKSITLQDSALGNDPIYVSEDAIWASSYNDILNIPFSFDGGGVTHLVNLYLDSICPTEDTLFMEFRHNANADAFHNRIGGLVSFDLSLMKDYLADKDSLIYIIDINRGHTHSYIDQWQGVYKSE